MQPIIFTISDLETASTFLNGTSDEATRHGCYHGKYDRSSILPRSALLPSTNNILRFDSLKVRQVIRIDNNTIIPAGHNPDTN